MKTFFLIPSLLLSFLLWGQETFYSPFTHNLDIGLIENIDREIVIDKEQIIIKSKTEDRTDFQNLIIHEVTKKNIDSNTASRVYRCTSKDGKFHLWLTIPILDEVEIIDVFIPNQEYHSTQHLRFYVDRISTDTASKIPTELN